MNEQLELEVFSLRAGHRPSKHTGFASVRQKPTAYKGSFRFKKSKHIRQVGALSCKKIGLKAG